ncbi:MAG: sigma-70 family RNA polymerase sigma factor [Patescibacteria group bacterium]
MARVDHESGRTSVLDLNRAKAVGFLDYNLRGQRHKTSVMHDWRDFLASGRTGGYLELPTGADKTIVAEFVALGLKTIVTSSTRETLDETKATIESHAGGIEVTNYDGRLTGVRGNVINTTLPSLETLSDIPAVAKGVELIIVDDDTLGRQRQELWRRFPNALFVGLTTTSDFSQRDQLERRGTVDPGERWTGMFKNRIHRLSREELVTKAKIGERIAAATDLPSINNVLDDMVIMVRKRNQAGSVLDFYRMMAELLPDTLRLDKQEILLEGISNTNVDQQKMGKKALLFLNLRSVFTVVQPHFSADEETNVEILQTALLQCYEKMKNKKTTPQQILREGATASLVRKQREMQEVIVYRDTREPDREDGRQADLMSAVEERAMIASVLGELSERERKVIELRFGIGTNDWREQTLEEVGHVVGVSGRRISVIETKTLSKLRDTRLRKFLDDL